MHISDVFIPVIGVISDSVRLAEEFKKGDLESM